MVRFSTLRSTGRQRPGAAAALLALVVSVLGGFWYSVYSGLSLGGLDAPLGLVVAGAVLVIALAAGAINFVSDNRLSRKVDVPAESVAIPTDITAIQRGLRHERF